MPDEKGVPCPNCGSESVRLALAIDYDPFAERHGLDQPGDQIRYCWKCRWSEPVPAVSASRARPDFDPRIDYPERYA